MLKYLAKISMDIFPSVLATIIGAYIVNHYINARPAPTPAAVTVAPAEPNKDAKPAGATDVANLPAPAVKAKGVSEKSVEGKPVDVKPAETASAPAETATANSRAHQPASREKGLAKATPAPAAPVEANAAATPDANDLARAAIERLRKTSEAPAQEAAHAAETPHVQEGPRVVTAAPASVRPLPPPITVSSPAPEVYGAQQPVSPPPYTASVGGDDANRPTPPADIPVPVVVAPPLDLRADAAGPVQRPKTNVADEMLSGVKSMFHAVLPKNITPD